MKDKPVTLLCIMCSYKLGEGYSVEELKEMTKKTKLNRYLRERENR